MANIDREQLGELLSAYVDNELDERERAFVERLLESNVEARQWYESLRRTVAAINTLPKHTAPASLAGDLVEQLERQALVANEPAEKASTTLRFPWFGVTSAAAVLIAAALVGINQFPQWFSPGPARQKIAYDAPAGEAEDRMGAKEETLAFELRDANEAAPQRARVDMADKLDAGADVDSVRTHDFTAEPVRLSVVLKDRRSQEVAVDRIVAHLAGAQVVDASSPAASGVNLASHAFFVTGKAGVNYADQNQRQVFVRLPVDAVDGLLDEVAVDAVDAEQVTLAAGSLRYDGLDTARRTLQPLEGNQRQIVSRRSQPAARSRRRTPPAARDERAKKGKESDGVAIELLKTLDIAPEVAASAQATEQPETAGTPAPTAGRDDTLADRVASRERAEGQSDLTAADGGASLGRGKGSIPNGEGARPGALPAVTPTRFITLVLEFSVAPNQDAAAPSPGTGANRQAKPTDKDQQPKKQ